MKRLVISATICVVTLQTILVGIARLASLGSGAGRPVPNHLSKRRSTPRIQQRPWRKRWSSLGSRLCALRPLQHTDGSARAVRRHRHSSSRELRALSSSLAQCTAHWFCFRLHARQRSSAIRHDQL